jgi:sugar lactone lactonase YvrE
MSTFVSSSRRLSAVACPLVFVVASLVAQQARPAGVLAEYKLANAAFAKKDYRSAVQHFTRALGGAPSHPGLMAELARAEFLSGNRRSAIGRLTRALTLGGGLDVVEDPAMASLVKGEDAAPLREAAASLSAPLFTNQVAFRIAERDVIPEGMAYDPVDRTFFVGSIYRRKILRIDATGRVTDFAAEQQDGLLSVLGMKVDPRRRVLFAATEGNLNMKDAQPGDDGRAALMKYDLESGRLVKKYEPVAADRGRHLFNDVAVDEQGNAWVTDSEAGSVYMVAQATDRLERLVGPGVFEYPNGIALSSDERRLFVAHVAGIGVIDLATRRVAELPHADGITLVDIDGLYREGHRLIAVQNGLSPARIAQFTMTDAEDRVTGLAILERGHPLFASIPTTGTLAEGWFYFIANAQLRAFTPDHHILPFDKLQETVILKTRLSR